MRNLSRYHLLFMQILFLYSKIAKNCNKSKQVYILQLFSIHTVYFDARRNKHFYYGGEYCIEQFCKNRKKHANEIMNSEKWK